ncbi:hypothetical protein CDES_13555 [Corynebacterium deserti GIMN1.010]|uniref:PTS EIIA type-2 domain-containing protein n=1 Tax=Corynebacterium deserti GIMN1.010 TaxID=931089 RepID=A0A0M4CFR6_9CORY|nr:fructose PTS transporter subunit IIA [Corynebacterium deserti]ALC07041.1 hypothetical protein CDES_13555 [Corynebacterium deserti GIMN1.010]
MSTPQSLAGLIDPELVELNAPYSSKQEVFEAVAKRLVTKGVVSDADALIRDIEFRETQGKTGIGNLIAIPHAKSSSVNSPSVSVIVLDQEIEWETLDDAGVQGIILFAVNDQPEGAREHLRLLSLFARKLAHTKVTDALIHASSTDDVVAAFA